MKKTIFIFFLGLIYAQSEAQTVNTYAGMQYIGSGSYTGYRNNKKDSVLFSAPMGIAIDTAGRMYVSNEHNLFWIQGNTAFLAAGYTLDPNDPGAADSKDAAGSVARFFRPAGMAVNPNTNEMMVADLGNNQIRKVERFINTSTQQIVSTFAGLKQLNGAHQDGANLSAKFNGPAGIAVASNGDIYVADRNNHCIRKISGGSVSTIAGVPGTQGHVNGTGSSSKFSVPYNLILDGNTLLVADYGNGAIRKIDLSNNSVTDVITSGLFGPKDLCKVGTALYIAESLCVKKYDNSTLSLYAGSNSQQGYVNADGTSARFNDLTGIVYHPKDKMLYVVDMGNNVVRSISPNARPVCAFDASTTSATKGQTVILYSTSTNAPTAYKWTITPGTYTLLNNSTLNDSLIYVSFSQIGTYNVKLYVSNLSGADSLLKNNYISVNNVLAAPVADFKASKTNPSVNEVIDLIDLSTNSPSTWTWRISPGYFIWMNGTDSNSQIPNVKFTNGNNFTITLIVSNSEGENSKTKVDYITVNTKGVYSISNSDAFRCYPNPADDILNIRTEEEGMLMVSDAYGRTIISKEVQAGVSRYDASELEMGTYILTFVTNSRIYTQKVIVNH